MKGACACGNSYTAQAAADILEAGGNACDALVAAALASGVTEAALTSLGGGGFALFHHAASGKNWLYDFFVNTPGLGLKKRPKELDFRTVTVEFPASTQDFHIGLASVAVPGTLKGLLKIHNDWGSMPLSEVALPAISFADQGFKIDAFQAYCFELLTPIFTAEQEIKELFCPQGRPPEEGQTLRNPKLASFLRALPDSIEEFYRGNLAQKLVAFMEEKGGLITQRDLVEYEVVLREPLEFTFSQGKLFTNPPPAFGGGLIALSLKLFDQAYTGGDFLSQGHLQPLVQVLNAVHHLREQVVKDDPFRLKALLEAPKASKGTTHISIVDAQGNLAALTMTFGEASGFLAPDTGIVLNNIMGEDDLHPRGFFADPPGYRIPSMMAPTLLVDEKNKTILGSGGSKRIRSAIFEVVINLAYFNLDPERAVKAPRLHFDGQILQVEPGIEREILEKTGLAFNLWPVKDLYFGGVHVVNNHFEGAGDPRRAGIFLRV